ncbi:MAG: 3'-5' exonuclease [Paludibacter sp.]
MTFTAIDFETAEASFPCEIGLTRVVDGVITFTGSQLIKPSCFPYMNYWNQRVHGITSHDVAFSPTFEELWSKLQPLLDDTYLVAHNAAFDMRVLRSVLEYYDLARPKSEYFCSVSLSRKIWKHLPKHSLDVVSRYHDIQFNHHRAGDDAKACALITLKAFEELNAVTVEEGVQKSGISLKKL